LIKRVKKGDAMSYPQTAITTPAATVTRKYAAFISYKRDPDLRIATAIQSALHQITKPWYRIRAMRVFRDKTDLAISHKLWASIQQGLEAAEYFIILASPHSAGSEWVKKEIRYWVENRSADKLLIVLTGGDIIWDSQAGGFDWGKTTALPIEVQAAFTEEPNYLDLRWATASDSLSLRHPQFKEAMADLAARIQGKDKSEILGEDVRQYRRTIRLARAAVVTLLFLTLIASGAAVFAFQQRAVAEARRLEAENQREEAERQRKNADDQRRIAEFRAKEEEKARKEENRQRLIADAQRREAVRQRQIALARQISAQSEVTKNQALHKTEYADQLYFSDDTIEWPNLTQRSMLLAIEGFRRLPSIESEQALRGALSMLPRSVTILDRADEEQGLFFSENGNRLLMVGKNRMVKVWDFTAGAIIDQFKLDAEISRIAFRIAFSSAGKYLAIIDEENSLDVFSIDGHKKLWRRQLGRDTIRPVFSDDANLLFIVEKNNLYILDTISGVEQRVLSSGAEVMSFALSPDGKRLAAASEDDTTRIWEIATGTETARINSSGGVITFSPDGKLIALASETKANIWDAKSGQLIQPISGIPNNFDDAEYIVFARFSADGSRLATLGEEGTCHLWDVRTGDVAWVIGSGENAKPSLDGRYIMLIHPPGIEIWDLTTGKEVTRVIYNGEAEGFAFNPFSNLVALTSDRETVVFDTGSGQEVSRVEYRERRKGVTYSRARLVVPSPDRKYLALGGAENTPIWDLTNAREICKVNHNGRVNKMAFSQDSKYLATAGNDDTVRIWEAHSGREIKSIGNVPAEITVEDSNGEESQEMNVDYVYFSPKGGFLLVKTHRGDIKVISIAEGKEIASGRSVIFSPDEKIMASQGIDGVVQVIDLEKKRSVFSISDESKIQGFAFGGDGHYLTIFNGNNLARVFDAPAGREISRTAFDANKVPTILSPDGKWLATAEKYNMIRVWNLRTGREDIRVNHKGETTFFEFRQNGRYLIVAGGIKGGKYAVQILDLGRKKVAAFLLLQESVNEVFFTPDEKHVVLTGNHQVALVVSLQSGRVVAKLSHDNIINDVAFSKDGKYIATTSSDRTARVWDFRDFQEVARVTHDNEVFMANFTPDGRYLVTTSSDQTARVWLLNSKDMIERACNGLTRNLTRQEWRQYFGAEPYHKTCAINENLVRP
jgi:WD40 repeat protein